MGHSRSDSLGPRKSPRLLCELVSTPASTTDPYRNAACSGFIWVRGLP